MKKTVIALLALLAVFACARNEMDCQHAAQDQKRDNTPMSFKLSVKALNGDPETKAALKADWNSGDVVYIFFDAIPAKYVKKTFDGAAWSEEYPGGAFVAGDFPADDPAASRHMTAVWFPQGEVTVTYANGKFSFTIGGEKIYSHYMSVQADYTVDATTVTGTLHLEKPAGFVQFFVPGIAAADASAYRLTESHLTPKACDYVALDGGVSESTLSAGYSLKGMAFTSDASVTGALFGGYLSSAGTATSYKFSLIKEVSSAKPAAEGTYTLVGFKTIAAGTSMTFPTIASGAWGEMSPFVYLGFGDIQWATGNLQDDGTIASPLAAGDYYKWGATKKYGESGDESYWVSEELPASRDIAALRSSGEWHMPSQAQFNELADDANTTGAWYPNWTSLGSTKGGYLITSKVNGISLFFAAAGVNVSNQLGDYGYCWSSSPEGSSAMLFYFGHDLAPTTGNVPGGWGVPVRPITGAPTPAPLVTDISTLSSYYYTAVDGETLTGTLVNNVEISIADGATVTLDGVSINADGTWHSGHAGITCLGDATIILKDGSTNIVKGFDEFYPGIFVPGDENPVNNKTLTIQGTGSLTASCSRVGDDGFGAGIGGGGDYYTFCGNIVIEGGTITATGGSQSAGIGSSYYAKCGTITISGGTVVATGGENAAGIGGGYYTDGGVSCGDISITGGTVNATGGEWAAGIGGGEDGGCGDISITGGNITAYGGRYGAGIGGGYASEYKTSSCGAISISGGIVKATGGRFAPGIGCGTATYAGTATCDGITIANTVTSVTATKGQDSPNSIGVGSANPYGTVTCGTVTIGGVVTGNITTSPYYYPAILNGATAGDEGKVVCAAGHLHEEKTAVPAGCTAVGILGKVTSTGHGLILALKNAASQTGNTIYGWSSVSYAGTSLKVLPDNAARGSLASYTMLGSTTVSNWAVAQMEDYSGIFMNLGSTTNDDYGYTYDDNVNAHITTDGAGDALSDGCWSASSSAGGGKFAPSYYFHADGWSPGDKTETHCVRPVLGF